jgi:Tol biopolymer transport system component
MNPVIDPTMTKIAYRVASQSARKNGVYVLDMLTPPITLQSASKQIADDTTDIFSDANLAWSPDGTEMLASISAELRLSNYLLKSTQMNEEPQNVTAILSSVELDWDQLKEREDLARMNGLKKELRKVITDNFRVLSWSPDETKLLYVASSSAELPLIIKPRLPGINKLTEDRRIETGKVYVYDLKEDTNNMVLESIPEACEQTIDTCRLPISWFADSNHLIYVHDKRIDIMEYDGTNQTTIYAGPFIDSYVFPWPNGDQLVILTDLNNPQITPNLYPIGLK